MNSVRRFWWALAMAGLVVLALIISIYLGAFPSSLLYTRLAQPLLRLTLTIGVGLLLGIFIENAKLTVRLGRVFAPCLPDEAAEFEGEKQEEEPRGTETILLLEDDEMVLMLTTTMLTALGYTVLTAETPAAALALADEVTARIDLLATDVVMPEMNGRELSERIAGRRPGIRTLFISGYSTNAVTLHALLDPGTILLQKPFSRIDLARKVREALAGS